jgi:serine acetyltransferase
MSAGSSIIGPATIGTNVMLEAHTHVIKTDLPDNVRVGGVAPHTIVPQSDRALRYFFKLPNTEA